MRILAWFLIVSFVVSSVFPDARNLYRDGHRHKWGDYDWEKPWPWLNAAQGFAGVGLAIWVLV